MQKIKIFLGSSLDELYNERRLLGDYIMNSVRPIFKYDDVDVELLKCEDMDLGFTGDPSQNIINDQLNDCNYFIFVFKKKAGGQTRLEYDIARAIQKAGTHQNTTIRVYILSGPDEGKEQELLDFQEQLKKDGLYWSTFNNPEDIRGKIEHHLIQFERQLLGKMKPSIIDEESTTEKDADVRFNEYMLDEKKQAQRRKKIHKDIEDLLQQTKTVMANEDETIAARIFKVIELYKKADQWAAATAYDKEKYSHLLFDFAQLLNEYGLYKDAEEVFSRQISIAEELYGKEHKNTATSYSNIGLVNKRQGDYGKALEYYQKALAIDEKVLGTEHPDTAISYNNIGGVYDDLSDYSKALEYYQKALAIDEKVLGTEHLDIATLYNNIGTVNNKLGNYGKALEYYQKALAIDEKVLGTKHHSTATSYNNIGEVYRVQGNYDKALEYHFKALAIRKKALGMEHSYTAQSYNSIGTVYYDQNDYSKAMDYYLKALTIREKVLGTEHPDTATLYNNIAGIYYKQGDFSKTLEYLIKASKVFEKVFGKEHPSTAQSYNNIGGAYDGQGDYNKAFEYHQKALAIREKVLGTEHPDTALSYWHFGSMYLKKGNLEKALEYLSKAYQIYEKVLGSEHPYTKMIQDTINFIYFIKTSLGSNDQPSFPHLHLPVHQQRKKLVALLGKFENLNGVFLNRLKNWLNNLAKLFNNIFNSKT